jgi:hypothetical protein
VADSNIRELEIKVVSQSARRCGEGFDPSSKFAEEAGGELLAAPGPPAVASDAPPKARAGLGLFHQNQL